MEKYNHIVQGKAVIRKILLTTDNIGDRNYTLVLDFVDESGNEAIGFYTYTEKSLYKEGDLVDISYSKYTEKEKRKLSFKRTHKKYLSYTKGKKEYAVEVINAQNYIDPQYITFTKNQYPGNKTIAIYILIWFIAIIIIIISNLR